MKAFWLTALLLFCGPAFADNQAGVAVVRDTNTATYEARLMNNGVNFNVGFDQKSHGGFLADFEVDRLAGQTVISPSFGYQFYTQAKRFQPYAYALTGDTTTVGQGSAFTISLAQGTDFRLTRRYSLRFEHESDWSRVERHPWDQRYTLLLVIRLR